MHEVELSWSWNRPASQLVHADKPVASATVPGLHGLHAALLLDPVVGLCDPAGHAVHAALELLPMTALNRPAAHAVHPPPQASASSQKPPMAQVSHVICPREAWYLPTSHVSHAVAPSCGITFPASHLMHEMLPLELVYLPGLQSAHAVRCDDWRLPRGQAVQWEAPRGRWKPGEQGSHWPYMLPAFCCVCASHSMQNASECLERRVDGSGHLMQPKPVGARAVCRSGQRVYRSTSFALM